MLSWLPLVAGTFALSILTAYGFLRLRCRGIGSPFGPRARWWALTIVMIVAAVSTGLGIALAVNLGSEAVYLGAVLPAGLWFIRLPPQRDRDMRPRTLVALPTLPFSRLYERMGDDMQDWCDTRLRAASAKPQSIADAANYYYEQVERAGLKDGRALANLGRWRESITHKIGIVRMISLDTTPARLRAALQADPSTQRIRVYPADDPPRLARRLETEALNELNLFLAYTYRLGYHRLLIYPYRPSAHRVPARNAEPTASDL
jgi:hypothetical protein